jgi:hypothetical protein
MNRPLCWTLIGLFLGACATTHSIDYETTCTRAQDQELISRAGPHELVELSLGTPAESDAWSAYRQRIAGISLGGIGAATLATGFVLGFAVNGGNNSPARTAGYALAGSSIGVFAAALLLAFTSRGPDLRARQALTHFGASCR